MNQYLDMALEFEALAAATADETMQKRYVDIAAGYRLLARERERLIASDATTQQVIDPTAIGAGPPR